MAGSAPEIRRHFLAEGFGKVLKVDEKIAIHRNICTICRPATNLVDPGGTVAELNVACSDELQLIVHPVEEDSRDFFTCVICDHGVLVLRHVVLHPIRFHKTRTSGVGRADTCGRLELALAAADASWTFSVVTITFALDLGVAASARSPVAGLGSPAGALGNIRCSSFFASW